MQLFPTLLFAQPGAEHHKDGKLLRGEVWQKFVVPESADFYVAKDGSDNWTGTLPTANADRTDGPFASIGRAKEAVKILKAKLFKPKTPPVETRWIGSPHPYGTGKDILVLIREGYYTLREPLVFSTEDGGERIETNLPTGAFEYHKLKDHYVTYAAYPGEKPVLSGGYLVNNWKKKGDHWIAEAGSDSVSMLVADGYKQVLARTPNEGYFVPPAISSTTSELLFNPGELKSWKDMQHNRVHMLLRWHQGHNSFSVIDEKSGVAQLAEPQPGVVVVPPRYYVENVKALMDAPSEWYFDPERKEVSFILPEGNKNPNEMQISAPQLEELLVVRGERGKPVRNLRIYGLTFEGALEGKSAVTIAYAYGNEFVDNELRAASGTGIYLAEGCYQTKILNNTIHGVDNMAIRIHGPEEPQSGKDILRETQVSFNHISNCGGVNIDAAFSMYTTISHNYITKTRGRYAISVGGWHNLEEAIDGAYLVEYNHLDDVQKDADDSGAIKTAGTTFNSVVRRNLIHDVNEGFFNDNVGFWFDNMSLGFVAKENIFYNLEQGEMKLCAANLVDNLYVDNYVIDEPEIAPETFISGEPEFSYSNLQIHATSRSHGNIESGTVISVSARVKNNGSTGISTVPLYLDGKVYKEKKVPIVKGNVAEVDFSVRLFDAGKHQLAIGATEYKEVTIEGERPSVVFEDLTLSDAQILKGETGHLQVNARNLGESVKVVNAQLSVDGNVVASKQVELAGNALEIVSFDISLEPGSYEMRVENSNAVTLDVQEFVSIDPKKTELFEYCSAKAKPFEINVDKANNSYRIEAAGTDFFHAEDSYAAVYMKKLKGDFVATVKIKQFGDRTHEWFRAGLFARNDMEKSFDTQPGSKGSFLMFGTPGRAGVNYDEFANGCMHKASSQNLPENTDLPYWLKLERHGNYFVGSISLDGATWINEKRSGDIPGLAEEIDLGLAAGAPDQKSYWVEFADWKIKVAK